jgi:acyl carrier protein
MNPAVDAICEQVIVLAEKESRCYDAKGPFTRESTLREIAGSDSLSHIEFLMELEKHFFTTLRYFDIPHEATIQEIAHHIHQRQLPGVL